MSETKKKKKKEKMEVYDWVQFDVDSKSCCGSYERFKI